MATSLIIILILLISAYIITSNRIDICVNYFISSKITVLIESETQIIFKDVLINHIIYDKEKRLWFISEHGKTEQEWFEYFKNNRESIYDLMRFKDFKKALKQIKH